MVAAGVITCTATQNLLVHFYVLNNCTELTCTWVFCWIVFSLQLPPAGSLASSQRRQLVKTLSGISHVTLLLPVVLYVLCGRLLIARLSSFPRQPSAEPLCPPLTRLATVLRRPDRERGADFYILSLLGVLDLFRFLMCCFARLRPALCAFTVFNPLRNAGPWLRTTCLTILMSDDQLIP
jgi:hypothetical protein